MLVFGANPHRACSELDMVGRQFIFGANHYRARAGLELGADSEKFVENLE